MSNIVYKFQSELRKNFGFIYKHRIGVAVSGGPDSVSLLLLLYSIKEFRNRIVVLHFDHRLRNDSSADCDFVKDLSKRLRLSFLVGSSNAGLFYRNNKFSLEQAARVLRYNFFDRAAKALNLDYIALAHTANDQAETVILRITRGTGLVGLSGIPEKRGIFVRPLLSFLRKDLIAFLNENNQEYRIDETNSDTKYQRNYIRINVIPALKKINSNLSLTISKSVKHLSKENGFIDRKMQECLRFFNERLGFWEIKRDRFLDIEEVLQFRLINFFYMKIAGSFYNPPLNFTENSLRLIKKGNGMTFYGNFEVVASCGYVAFMKKKADLPIDTEMSIGNELSTDNITIKTAYCRKSIQLAPYKYEKNSNCLYFDLHKTEGKLHLKSIKQGDRFIPFGKSNEVKVHRFLMKRMIPSYFRKYVYALCDRKGMIAVVPIQIAERVKIDTQSSKIIKIIWKNRR